MVPKGLNAAAKEVQENIEKIIKGIEKAGTVANAKMKELSLELKKAQTLQSLQTQKVQGAFGDNAKLGQQARAFAEYRQATNESARASDVLRGRLRALTDEQGRLLKSGKEMTSSALFRADKIKETASAYTKVSNEINTLRGRIALMGDASRKAFEPMLKNLDLLDKKNAASFANNRKYAFGPELRDTQLAARNLKEQVNIREKLEQKTRLNTAALKEEGRQIIANTVAQREARLAAAVRGAQTEQRNSALIGSNRFGAPTDQTQRSIDLTTRLTAAKVALNKELSRSVPRAKHLDERIKQVEELEKKLGRAALVQAQFNAQQDQAKTGGFIGGFKKQAGDLLGGENGGTFGAGALVARVGGYALAAAAVYGLVSALKEGISFAIEFEDSLAQLQAISGSTQLEMERLTGAILDVSQNSSSSVLELTKAATIIAQAGFAGSEVTTLLDSVTKLSDASGATADQSVDILTSALGSFQLEASEATRITDGLVAALNDSKLAVQQVQLGLQYLGAVAQENNITFEELTAIMGAAADAGIKSGSTAATGTRQLLIDLIDPSKKLVEELTKIGLTTADIDVKTLGFVEVLTRLKDAGFQAYGTIETRAAAMFGVLSENTDQIDRLIAAQTRQGVAEQAQAARLDSLSAKWQIFLNTLSETGALISAAILPALKLLTDAFTGIFSAVNALLGLLGNFFSTLGGVGDLFGSTGSAAGDLRDILMDTGLSSSEADVAIQSLGGSLLDVETAAKDAEAGMAALEEKERTLQGETDKLILRKDDLAGSTSAVANQVNLLSSRFPGLRSEFAKTQGGIGGLIQAMMNLEDQARRTITAQARVVLSTQGLRKQEANKSAVGVRDRVSRLSSSLGFMNGADVAGSADVQKFQKMVNAKQYDAALDFYNAAPKGSVFKKDKRIGGIVSEIANFRYEYEDSNSKVREAESTIKIGNFRGTKEGRDISLASRTSAQNATRAASQGTADGQNKSQVRAGINGNLSSLDALEAKYKNDPDILGFLGGVRSSQNAALSQLADDPAEKDKKKAGGKTGGRDKADRAKRDFARVESAIAKEEVEYKKELYENQLKALENAPTLEALPDILQDVDAALSDYLNADKELALQAVKQNNPNAQQELRLLAAASRKAEELRLESIDKVSDVLSAAIKKFIDETSKSIELQYAEATRFTQRNADIANARLRGLDNPIGANNRPEYFKTVVRRQAEVAEDRAGRAQVPANERRIAQYDELKKTAQETKTSLESDLAFLGKILAKTTDETKQIEVMGARNAVIRNLKEVGLELIDLETKTLGLRDANEDLRASYGVLNEAPKTFGAGIATAIEAVKIDIGAADNIGQELINNLDTPLKALHEGFKGFFTDIASGTVSLAGAFKNLAGSVIDSLIQMAAVAAANQLFSFLANAFAPGSSPAVGGSFGSSTAFRLPGVAGGSWRGGEIKGMYGGGDIQTGISTRDSTLIHAAKGEYMLRRSAAQSIGKDTLDAMNARGADAMSGMGNVAMPAPMPTPVQTNVYVIAPEEKPQLGPNDVLAIFSNDVLKGGSTKRLIKQVANG